MKPTALQVAKYILCIAHNYGDVLTNLKLQKLLYYAQAWYLVNNNNCKLFDEEIEAWQHGPVVREVYDRYKKFKGLPIEEDLSNDDVNALSEDIHKYMSEFLDEFMDYSATSLVNMTHSEAPWIEAYNRCKCGGIISTDSMYNYYSKL